MKTTPPVMKTVCHWPSAPSSAGASALQVAEHLARAAQPGDTEAIRWLTRAAREAVATSPDAAASLLARAAGLMDPADPGRDTLLAEQAGGLVWAGRLGEAETVCRMLLASDNDPSVTPAARIYLAHALLAGGRAGEALRELERVAGSAAPGSAELAVARAVGSFARLNLGDLDGAWSAAAAAQSADSPTSGHQDTTAAVTSLALAAEQHASVAMTSQALAAQLRGDLSVALQIADDLAGLADRSPGRHRYTYPVLWVRGLTLIELDRLEEARSALQASIRMAEEFGVELHLPVYQLFLAFERFTAGDWDDALADNLRARAELAEYRDITREFTMNRPGHLAALADVVTQIDDISTPAVGQHDATSIDLDLAERIGELQAATLTVRPPGLAQAEAAAARQAGFDAPPADADQEKSRLAELDSADKQVNATRRLVDQAAELAATAVANALQLPGIGHTEVLQVIREYLSGLIENSPLKDVFAHWLERITNHGAPPPATEIFNPDPERLKNAAAAAATTELAKTAVTDPTVIQAFLSGPPIAASVELTNQTRYLQERGGPCDGCAQPENPDDQPGQPPEEHPAEP